MSDKYFYCEDEELFKLANKYDLCSYKSANKIHADQSKQKIIINVLSDINKRLMEDRGGGVFVYSQHMSLSKYFPVFESV
jgi:hypothetical protein